MKLPFTRVRTLRTVPTLFLALAAGCVSDHNYDVDKLEDIDPTVTIFNGGISVPVGQTEAITLENVLKMASVSGLDSLLVADPVTGNYAITSKGDYNLDKVIEDMHLEKLRDIDGAYSSKDTTIVIGEIDPRQFTIEGKEYAYESEKFPYFNLDDIPVPELTVPDQVINTGLYKYMPDEDDLDIGKRVGQIGYSGKVLNISAIKAYTDTRSEEAGESISLQPLIQMLAPDGFTIEPFEQGVEGTISLGDNKDQIADIYDFVLKNGGQIKISMYVENCPLTVGTIIPDISLDVSSMFKLADAQDGKVSLKGLQMKNDNGWKTSGSFVIDDLKEGFLSFNKTTKNLEMTGGLAKLSGSVKIESAFTTKNAVNPLADKQMNIVFSIECAGVVLKTMEITLGNVSYSVPEVSVPVNIQYTLPDAIKSVNKIYLDQTKKFEIKIDAKGLAALVSADGNKHISVKPTVTINLPEGLEVAEAEGGNKVVIDGVDLYEYDKEGQSFSTSLTLVSLTPKNEGKSLTYSGNITADIEAIASGTVSGENLPKTVEKDLVVTAKMGGTPALKDYDVSLDEAQISKQIDQSQEFSFELEGMGDFGTFDVGLDGSPVISMKFDVPATSEVKFKAESLVVSVPSMVVLDAGGILIDGVSVPGAFDAAKNTITLIKREIPGDIIMPVKSLHVTPEAGQGGKTVVKGVFAVKGVMTLDKYEISKVTFDELSQKSVSGLAKVPSMTATTITLAGDFSKSLDTDIRGVVFLDKQTVSSLPKEIQSISKLDLDAVNALIELKVEGLPSLDVDFTLQNTKIILPEFMVGEGGTNELILDDNITVRNGQTISQKIGLSGLKNVQLSGIEALTGDVMFRSKLVARTPVVNLSTLQSNIGVHCYVGVGNGSKATVPGKIAISKADVKVAYSYNQSQSIALGEIPEALQADTVDLGLSPNLYLDLSTNFGAPVKGDFVITPYIGGSALNEQTVTVSGIELPYAENWDKTLVNKYAIGLNPTAESGVTVIRTDLSPLVRRIPDSLKIAIKVATDPQKDCIVYPEAQYVCGMSYNFNIPVNFSDSFSVNLNPSVTVDSTVSTIMKLAIANLTGSFSTTLPLGAECNVRLLDAYDREIALNKPATLKLLPGDGTYVKQQDFEVVLDIKDKEGADVKKIVFDIALQSSPGVDLNKGQYVQITGLKLTLPEGVTYDFEK